MANITTLRQDGAGHMTLFDGTKVYVAENVIDFADALTAKGSALAAADTIEALTLPAGTFVYMAGVQVIVPDDATTLTLDLGFTGGDVDLFVDGFDHAASAAGVYSAWTGTTPVAAQMIGATADTLDLLIATLTGTLATGKVRVWAVLCDVSSQANGASREPGIVQLGS